MRPDPDTATGNGADGGASADGAATDRQRRAGDGTSGAVAGSNAPTARAAAEGRDVTTGDATARENAATGDNAATDGDAATGGRALTDGHDAPTGHAASGVDALTGHPAPHDNAPTDAAPTGQHRPPFAVPRLILGSASPRRLDLLAQIGIRPAAIRPADIDETPLRSEDARSYVMRMAIDKARALDLADDEAALTADTTVAVGRRILGKPADRDEAASFMRLMSGRRHRVLTAIALRHGDRLRHRLVETTVRMRPIEARALDHYLDHGDWQGKAGGYAIQGAAAAFIPWIQGSFSAVVGLPLSETATLLAAIGIIGDTT